MTVFVPGEIVDITIRGARVHGMSIDAANPSYDMAFEYLAAGYVGECIHAEMTLTDAVTVYRVTPADGVPQPGDLWRDRFDGLYFARRERAASDSGSCWCRRRTGPHCCICIGATYTAATWGRSGWSTGPNRRPRTFVNDRFWVRSAVQHTPAHVVQGWDGKQVITACGTIPRPGGEVISYDKARRLHVHPCVSCTGMQVTAS